MKLGQDKKMIVNSKKFWTGEGLRTDLSFTLTGRRNILKKMASFTAHSKNVEQSFLLYIPFFQSLKKREGIKRHFTCRELSHLARA